MIEAALHRSRRVRRAVCEVALAYSSQSPFAHMRSRISGLLEQHRYGNRILRKELLFLVVERSREAKSRGIDAGQKAGAGGRADRRSRVEIGKAHAGPRQLIDVRSQNLSAAVTAQVTVSQVIGHYEHDVQAHPIP